jgi:hypothetical protein
MNFNIIKKSQSWKVMEGEIELIDTNRQKEVHIDNF